MCTAINRYIGICTINLLIQQFDTLSLFFMLTIYILFSFLWKQDENILMTADEPQCIAL